MYKYEEMDFNEILADPEIDPENAEVMIILIVIVTFVVKHFTELLDAFAPLLVFGLFCGVLKFLKSLSN